MRKGRLGESCQIRHERHGRCLARALCTLAVASSFARTSRAEGNTPVASVIGLSTSLEAVGCDPNVGSPAQVDTNLRDGRISDFRCSRKGALPPELILKQGSPTRVTGIRVYANANASNDPVNYSIEGGGDPIAYSIEGRRDSNEDWEPISDGPFNLEWFEGILPPPVRNAAGEMINSSYLEGDTTKSFGYATFENTLAYRDYRITFPQLRPSPPSSSSQPIEFAQFAISELELPGVLISDDIISSPTPTPGKKSAPDSMQQSPGNLFVGGKRKKKGRRKKKRNDSIQQSSGNLFDVGNPKVSLDSPGVSSTDDYNYEV